MDVPAPAAGRIAEVKVKKGDKVSEGIADPAAGEHGAERRRAGQAGGPEDAVVAEAAGPPRRRPRERRPGRRCGEGRHLARQPGGRLPPARARTLPRRNAAARKPLRRGRPAPRDAPPIDEKAFSKAYASPSVRKFARELGADLGRVKGTGPKGRITHEDVKAYVKELLTAPPAAAGAACPRCRGRFRAVRRGRDQAAVADPAHFRRAPAGQLDQSAACHAARGCRHHRSRDRARALKPKARRKACGSRRSPSSSGPACSRAARNFRASIPRWMRAARIWSSRNTSTSASPPIRPNGLVVPVIATPTA